MIINEGKFQVTYRVTALNKNEARTAGEAICLEQTLEFPRDLVRDEGPLRLLARVNNQVRSGHDTFYVTIEYRDEVAGGELTQLLNVIFGNSSLLPGIRVERLHLSPGILSLFKGPRFGRSGLRKLLGVEGRPLLCTALKPMGLDNRTLADLATAYVDAGIDIIKDDHGLANQPSNPFEDRVKRVGDAVREACARTGSRAIYAPNVTAAGPVMKARAALAKAAGAGGLLVSPGLTGFDGMQALAEDDDLALPIFCHPALLGSFLTSPTSGMSHHLVLGQLPRLAGADGVIFPSFGGRFSFSQADCKGLVDGTAAAMGRLDKAFPMPAGGLTLSRVPELLSFYGREVILLIGGDLHRTGDVRAAGREFRRLVEA